MRNPRHSPAPSFATDASAFGRRLHALLMRARRIKCFCGGAKTLLFKGKREAGNAPPATFQRDAASAAHRTSPCVATDVCTRVRTSYALLMRARRIKCFCEGAKTLLFKVKREPPARSKAHSARRTRCGTAASPRATTHRTHVPHPAHSAPAILLSVGRACPRPPQAGYARNVQSSTKKKSLRQNSRAARTIPIKSRPAACTSGGINNFPLK